MADPCLSAVPLLVAGSARGRSREATTLFTERSRRLRVADSYNPCVKVSSERLPDSQLRVEIEVEPDRVERSIEDAYKRLARRVKVPGFRPGKAPRALVERQLGGREALLHDALDRLVPEVYDEVVEEHELRPVDLPSVSITNLEPVTFTATVPLIPEVKLGDYKSLRVEREPVAVSEEEVEAALERLRQMQATLEPVDRPLQMGDTLRANVSGTQDGVEQFSQDDAEFAIQDGVNVSLPGFTDQLIGISRGETREFSLTIPDDYPDESQRGKQLDYAVTANEVKEQRLPTLDDELAKGIREGYDTLTELREEIRGEISREMERRNGEVLQSKILEQIVAGAEVEYPPVLVEREVDHILKDHAGRSGSSLEDQLQQLGKSEEQLKEELRPEGESRLRNSLVLGQIAEDEGIEATPEEINEELDRLTQGAGGQLRELFDSENGRTALRRGIMTRKTFERLVELIAVDPGTLPPDETEEAEAKPRRRRKAAAGPKAKASAESDTGEAESVEATDSENEEQK
ncbi:MAG: trigger factor [Dehalococcoidia bacterium]|nr:trigger factor [Dehalococcoidia bacterium]